MPTTSRPGGSGSWRAAAPLIAVVFLLQLAATAGLILGTRTLYLRDVLTTHLPMKAAQAAAWQRGELPVLDTQRGGGQPSLGNPNGVPLYPDNVLYLLAPARWVLGAHFWLHFLVAPWAAAWLARRLGCGHAAAWAGGTVYAVGGYFLSQLSYYNLVGGAAVAPALVAAALAARDGRRGGAAAAGALWALLLLAGDPTLAALALLATAAAVVLVPARGAAAGDHGTPGAALAGRVHGPENPLPLPLPLPRPSPSSASALPPSSLSPSSSRSSPAPPPRAAVPLPTASPAPGELGEPPPAAEPAAAVPPPPGVRQGALAVRLLLALALGTLVALPQLVELARAVPASVRGERGYSEQERTLGSWDPRQALEQVLPLAFGRVDRLGPGGFWGHRFHTDALPFYLTLYPGLLALALVAAAGRARGLGGRAAWVLVGGGLFLALGRFNPLLTPLLELPGAGLLRFPVKAWLLVAVGLAVLAAAGWQRAITGAEVAARRRLVGALAALGGGLAVAAAVLPLVAGEVERRLAAFLSPAVDPAVVTGEPHRWALTCAATALLAGLLLGATRLAAARPLTGGALLLGIHAAAQLLLLAPATLATDTVDAYEGPHSFAALLPAGTHVAHGSVGRLFGAPPLGRPPEPTARWLGRQGAAAAYPFVGVAAGWRFELVGSPEGLDGYLTRLAIDAVRSLPDAARVRLLQRWGVEALVLERPLEPGVAGAEWVASAPGPLGETRLYRLPERPPPVRLVHGARWAANPAEAVGALLDTRFDPAAEVVLAGSGPPAPAGRGEMVVAAESSESLLVTTTGDRPGWLVVERAWQPHWRATVAGRPAPVVPANLHRLAVAVPAGRQRVELWVDREPFARAVWGAAGGIAGLLALAFAGALRRPRHRW